MSRQSPVARQRPRVEVTITSRASRGMIRGVILLRLGLVTGDLITETVDAY